MPTLCLLQKWPPGLRRDHMVVFQNTLFKGYKFLTSDSSDAPASVPIAFADHMAGRVATDLVDTFAKAGL